MLERHQCKKNARMIKLTLNTDTNSTVFSFDKDEILIGNESSEHNDLRLKAAFIKELHLRITREEGQFVLINSAGDPFACLNGLPFGKKPLRDSDLIDLHGFKIHVELQEYESLDKFEEPQEDAFDLEALMKEVESLDSKATTYPVTETLSKDEKPSLKINYYLDEFDDESAQWKAEIPVPIEDPAKNGGLANHWRMLASLLFAIISLSTVICSGVYFRENGKNSQEEKKIAAGIADIAMALTNAKLNHIVPDKQNWSDPDFLRNILPRVIAPSLHTQAQIDSQGQFIDYPYRLRIYTSVGMDRFLVIAQPAPNIMQWIIHKKTLAIDSNAMELRKIADLKELNRLLANPDPLEDKNGAEVSRVLKEGTLMSLSSLTGQKNHWGFSPPKALGFFRPGAENNIYNAPRYYPFGEDFLRKAVHLYHNTSAHEDVSLLQDDMEEISRFSDIVLYTSQGLQLAVEAQKALASFAPHSKFLVAYVQFNPKGFVAGSQLLMNEGREEIAFLEPKKSFTALLPKPVTAEEENLELGFDEAAFNEAYSEESKEVERNHPLLLQLNALYKSRQHALKSLSTAMIEQLKKHERNFQNAFENDFDKLYEIYLKTDRMHHSKIVGEINKLSQEYSDMPQELFMEYTKKSKLHTIAHEVFEGETSHQGSEFDLEKNLAEITAAISLKELEDKVQASDDALQLNYFTEPEKVASAQDRIHGKVMDRLAYFILSAESPYAVNAPDPADRLALVYILENCWTSDSNEKEYFLAEFDRLKEHGSLTISSPSPL